jgi:DNA ligase (NAD+)
MMAKVTAADKKRIQELERVITHLDTLYEQGEDCVHPDTNILVTDGEYDSLRRELKELAPKSKLFATATASKVQSAVKKVVHDPPLTSIEKASHEIVEKQEEMLFKWLIGCTPDEYDGTSITIKGKSYKEEDVVIAKDYFYEAYKLDGVALALYYENGKLARAGLRPRDGINGEDVTEQCQYVDGIPAELKLPETCSIRGELICRLKDFDKVQIDLEKSGEKLRANPRNHAAGGIRQFKDPSKTKRMRLSFIAYTIEAHDNPTYQTEMERAEYCEKKLGVPYITTKPFKFEDLAKMEDGISKLDYEVDGQQSRRPNATWPSR